MNPQFRKLWAGQSISMVGSSVTDVALPLTAVLVLNATPAEMGWLGAIANAPMAVFGLAAGVWVDRLRRRPILVATDFGRAAFLGAIPLAALFGVLDLHVIYAVAFCTGTLSIFRAVADRAYLPVLLGRKDLVAGNSRLWFSGSFAQTVGPGFGGLLVQWLTAPIAIVIDIVTFVVSGLLIASIRDRESRPATATARAPLLADIREGLRRVLLHPILRPLVAVSATHNLFSTMIVALYALYLTRALGVMPAVLGLILVAGGIGSTLGSLTAAATARRLGIGPSMLWQQALTGVARFCVPLAMGSTTAIVAWLMISELVLGVVRAQLNITQISLRQALTPAELQGRVNASIGFLYWVFTPLGALAGGYLGDVLGLRATLLIAAAGVLGATAFGVFSVLRTTKTV